MLTRHFLLVILLCAIFTTALSAITRKRGRTQESRREKRIPIFPIRDQRDPTKCNVDTEYHVRCGPERHCDKSCDNMYSPPNCLYDLENTKCYFPRCLCKEGFVRDALGKCIRPFHCPNGNVDEVPADDDTITMEFKPMKREPKHKKRPNLKRLQDLMMRRIKRV